ncbi:hypothetical protein Pelo_7488 [Pelomyxa schiedti]|nr:hypothetical protein Pelo_7488 [Pelomyxa schiedti]
MDPQGTTTTRLISQGTNRTIGPGTPVYMAPQMSTAHYSVKGDMWGFGILMTEMLNGDIVDSTLDSLPLLSQANFMNELRRLLAPQEVDEVDKLCQESRESFIASCLSRRNASIDAVNHLMHSPDSPLLQLPDGPQWWQRLQTSLYLPLSRAFQSLVNTQGVSRAMDPQGTATTRLITHQGTNRTIGPGTGISSLCMRCGFYGVDHHTSPDNGTYTGRLVDGKRDGAGTCTWPDGTTYHGEWRDDNRHGRGLYTWPDGSTYDGEYSNGGRDGWGMHMLADRSRYDGLWRHGNWDRGAWFTKGDTASYCGYWEYNDAAEAHEMQGWGDHLSKDIVYDGGGMFDHSKKSGRGAMLFYYDGSYVGEWEDDMFHGQGVRLWANGDRLKTENQYLKQKLHEQTQCKLHSGVWVKSVSAPSPPLGRHSQGTQEEEEVKSRSCVMKKVSIKLENHDITFAESVCSVCPLDKVVKIAVEKQFGMDENQQVISFSEQSSDLGDSEEGGETTLSALQWSECVGLIRTRKRLEIEVNNQVDFCELDFLRCQVRVLTQQRVCLCILLNHTKSYPEWKAPTHCVKMHEEGARLCQTCAQHGK